MVPCSTAPSLAQFSPRSTLCRTTLCPPAPSSRSTLLLSHSIVSTSPSNLSVFLSLSLDRLSSVRAAPVPSAALPSAPQCLLPHYPLPRYTLPLPPPAPAALTASSLNNYSCSRLDADDTITTKWLPLSPLPLPCPHTRSKRATTTTRET